MATFVLKTAGHCRVATEVCIATMLPKSAMAELNEAADEQGVNRSALARIVLMRYLREQSERRSR